MKFTNYFESTRSRKDRQNIRLEWIEFTFYHPMKVEKQQDGRFRKWAKIVENENRILRIVVLEDGETIHNAFFDRTAKIL